MTGAQRPQMDMLIKVRNFGEANRGLFEGAPVAQQTFAAVGTAVAELVVAGMKKQAASAAARADRRARARAELIEMLQDVGALARNLRAEGRTVPPFDLPVSKSTQDLLTTGRRFAEEVVPFDAEFAGHGLGAAQITRVTAAFDAAVNDQGMSRGEHVRTNARIQTLLRTAIRGAKRLDLAVKGVLDAAQMREWEQLRRVHDVRGARGNGEGADSATPDAGTTPAGEADHQVGSAGPKPDGGDHAAHG